LQLLGIRPVLSISNLHKTMKNKLFILSILVIAIAAVNGCHSSTSPSNPSLQGVVFLVTVPPFWQGSDNSGTDIYVENTGYHTTTDSSGHFTIPSLDPSENTIIVSHSGYATKCFYHVWAIPQNYYFDAVYLYPFQPQYPALIDSVILKDTIIFKYTRTGVVVGTNGDTLNYGTVTAMPSHDTNVCIYGHSTEFASINAVIYLGLSNLNLLDTSTFFDVVTVPIVWNSIHNFERELPLQVGYYWPFVNGPLSGSKVLVSAFATPFDGVLSYSDSVNHHTIYSLFTGSPANTQTYIQP
jgi:hypothetical protein